MSSVIVAIAASGAVAIGSLTAVDRQSTAAQTRPPADQVKGQGTAADAEFIQKAWQAGKSEVELAEVARAHAENDAIEDLAAMIEKDHRDANAQLHMIADRLDVKLPDRTAEQEATEDRLETLRGAAFDREWVAQMIKDHEAGIELFTKASTSATEATVKTFAGSKLPALKEHLKRLQALKTAENR